MFILLSRNPALRQLLDTSLGSIFDSLTQPKPKLLLHAALVTMAKSQQQHQTSLAFMQSLKVLFCEKVAADAL